MAHVFISHRGSDTISAELLATELRTRGHHVWLDVWQISVGDSIVDKINQGLLNATHIILCYSWSGVDNSWINREWQSTLARQLNGQDVKILPIRLTGGDPPPILADLKYLDLVTDWNQGVRDLLFALQ